MVSSLPMEQVHEGCVDYAACEYLKQLIAEQEKSGNRKLAEFGRQVLKNVSANLPIQHDMAQSYSFLLSNENLDARRWEVFQAIDQLRGIPPVASIAAGKPSVQVQKSLVQLKKTNYVIKVKNAESKLLASAERKEKFWSDLIGPLSYLTEYEAQLRARASNAEEYNKMNSPSYSVFSLACLPEGLAVFSYANDVRPQEPFRYERVDDDGDMWKDDCFEFFFALPNGKQFHFIYNAAGAKTFMNTGNVIPAADIRSYHKSPVAIDGGTINKLLIPWRYFDLKQAPAPGTVWEFNVGREFHTYQTILSWARVASSFHEQDKWGRLVFIGSDEANNVKVAPSITIEPTVNRQVISGGDVNFNLESRVSGLQTLPVKGELTHSSGKKISLSEQNLPVGAAEFTLNTAGLEPGTWTLSLWVNGTDPVPTNTVQFMILPSPWR